MSNKPEDAPEIEIADVEPDQWFAAYHPDTGKIETCYVRSIHGETIPADTVEMSEAQFRGHINKSPRLKVDVDADPKVFVEDIPAPPSLDEIKATARGQMIAWINILTRQLKAGYPDDEVASWPLKTSEARVVLDGGAAGALITAEAAMIGESPEAVAQAVVAKADVYEDVLGAMSGLRRKAETDIAAATDAVAVQTALDSTLAEGEAEAAGFGLDLPS